MAFRGSAQSNAMSLQLMPTCRSCRRLTFWICVDGAGAADARFCKEDFVLNFAPSQHLLQTLSAPMQTTQVLGSDTP